MSTLKQRFLTWKATFFLLLGLLSFSPASATTLSKNDLRCIEEVVWAEARGESRKGRQAVAHVVLNRSKRRGLTPCQVTRQKGQFVRKTPPRSFKVDVTKPDPTNGATHFRVRRVPGWLGLKIYTRIGGHWFYGPR